MPMRPVLVVAALCAWTPGDAGAPASWGEPFQRAAFSAASGQPARQPDIHYVPTPQHVVEGMLRFAEVTPDDVVYDLGSGDGRIVITAAREFGARGVGIELDPKLIAESRRNARQANVEDRVRFIEGDIFEADLSEATVVTLYLLSSINEKLRPKLVRDLQPGARIVSHWFRMGDWEPDVSTTVDKHPVWLWRVPAR